MEAAWSYLRRSGALRARVETREGGAGAFGAGFARGARFGGGEGDVARMSSSSAGGGSSGADCLAGRFLGGAFGLRGGFLVVFLGAGASCSMSLSSQLRFRTVSRSAAWSADICDAGDVGIA
jgi:hypothetical protein